MDKNELKNVLRQKSAFIFDMDGTILDLEELNYQGYAQVIEKHYQLRLHKDDYQKYFSGTRTAKGFDGFLQNTTQIRDYSVDKLISDFREIKRDNLRNNMDKVVKLKAGFMDFVQSIKESGYKTCLATSTVKEFVDLIVDHFDLRQYFDVVLTADDVSKGKPDPQIYNNALERLGSTRDESIVFEDSKNGIQAAKNAKILCLGILTKGLNDEYVGNADFVIEDYNYLD